MSKPKRLNRCARCGKFFTAASYSTLCRRCNFAVIWEIKRDQIARRLKQMKPETQASLAARMAEMMGWTEVRIDSIDPRIAMGRDVNSGFFRYYQPFRSADDAIAFADWAEREGLFHSWNRYGFGASDDKPMVTIENDVYSTLREVEITPTTPFPAALSLAVARAIPELAKLMEGEHAE